MSYKSKLMAAAGFCFCISSAPAIAQTAAAATPEDVQASQGDIIVTANKRAERLQDVPAAVSAITGQTLEQVGAKRLEDYVTRVPGLVLDDTSFSNGAVQLTLRGLNTGTGGNPTVGIYIDDAPFGGSSNNSFGGSTVPDLDPLDLERVEVLRGPQGTLYGAGSLGGLFKYVTAAPDPTHAFGRFEIDGQFADDGGSGYGVRGAGNLPITDTLAIRASGFYREDPGFIDNVTTGQTDVNRDRVYGGRVSLGWKLGDNWSLRATALLQRDKADGSAVADHDLTTFAPEYGDLDQARAPGTGKTASFIGDYALTLKGDLGFATLTSASSYDRQTVDFNLDVTAAYGGLLADNGIPGAGVAIVTNASLDKFTQEVRLASPDSGAFSWQVGAFYTHEHALTHQYFSAFSAATGEPYPVPLPTLLDAHVDADFEEIAGFGDVTWKLTPAFDVTAGIRYSHNRQPHEQTNSGVFIGDGDVLSTSRDSSVTYLVTPRLHLGPDTMLYARVATGYRPGGPNNPVPGTPTAYGPDRTTNYEVGLKEDLAHHTLSIDLSAYWIDWSNIQLNLIENGLNFNGNGGRARSRGIEGEVSWRPLPGLSFDGSVSYDDAVLAEDLPPGPAVGEAGDRLPSVPKWTTQADADYEFPLNGTMHGVLGASVRYVGDRIGYFAGAGVPRYYLPSYTVGDLRGGIRVNDVTMEIFVKNVGNAHGQVAAYTLGPDARVSVIQPRTVGLSLSTQF